MEEAIRAVDPKKDVDGFHPHNLGCLMIGYTDLEPCTPRGIMTMLAASGVDCEGKRAVVVGRSMIVGRPMAQMLVRARARRAHHAGARRVSARPGKTTHPTTDVAARSTNSRARVTRVQGDFSLSELIHASYRDRHQTVAREVVWNLRRDARASLGVSE